MTGLCQLSTLPSVSPFRCNDSLASGDKLTFFDGPSTAIPVHRSVCGSSQSVFRLPSLSQETQALSITSSGSHLTMLFTSDEYSGKFEYGFRLNYKFQDDPLQRGYLNGARAGEAAGSGRVVYFNYDHILTTSGHRPISALPLTLYIIIGK